VLSRHPLATQLLGKTETAVYQLVIHQAVPILLCRYIGAWKETQPVPLFAEEQEGEAIEDEELTRMLKEARRCVTLQCHCSCMGLHCSAVLGWSHTVHSI
jgi:hypothetical protein